MAAITEKRLKALADYARILKDLNAQAEAAGIVQRATPIYAGPNMGWRTIASYPACPLCGQPSGNHRDSMVWAETGTGDAIIACPKCDALYGTAWEHSKSIVSYTEWHKGPSTPEEQRYYDFTKVNENGIDVDRRHGWFHKETGKITQTG